MDPELLQLLNRLPPAQQAAFHHSQRVLQEREARPQQYTTGPGFPDSSNVYVPSLSASGPLIVGYSRNINRFRLPRYVEYRKSSNTVGLFMKLSPQMAARVPSTDDFHWPDNSPRPHHNDSLEQFNTVEYRTKRFDYGFNVGWRTSRQAAYPLVQVQKGIQSQQCMTARTKRFVTAATTASSWQTAADPDLSSDHTATAASFVGTQLDLGTSTNPAIKKFLNKAAILIAKDTLGAVQPTDLHVVMAPSQAHLWSESSEVHEYIKQSPAAQEELRTGLGPNTRYGLPSTLYGYQIEIEDAVQVTSQKGATLAKSFIFPDQQVLVAGRPGALEGVEGAPAFSTLTLFYFEEMTVEERDEPYDRLTRGNVVEDVAEVVTSPLSGYLLTSSTSVAG